MKNITTVLVFIFFGNFIMNSQEVHWDQTSFTTENLKRLNRGAKTTVRISKRIEVKGNVVVPKNVTLTFSDKGMLAIYDESSSITILGSVANGPEQIFDLENQGVVTYDHKSVSNIKFDGIKTFYPEWWGILPNEIPNNPAGSFPSAKNYTYIKEMMLDVASSGGGEIHFSKGTYYIRDIVIDFSNITISGEGKETVLKFDRKNFKYSTRRGGIFTIQGPTSHKYYNKLYPDGVYQMGNFLFDKGNETIENITIRDLSVEWDDVAAMEDPAMNGMSIVNATNVMIDNVHIDLFGANRAFYIATLFDGDTTENITIKNSSCVNSRTGVFILHGFDEEGDREYMALGDIQIENNVFDVVPLSKTDVKNKQLTIEYLDSYSSGIFFAGSEYTSSFKKGNTEFRRNLGAFVLKNNTIKNADFGIRSLLSSGDKNKAYSHDIRILGNTFEDFNYIGIFSPFSKAVIVDNTFKSSQLSRMPATVTYDKREVYIASAIQIAKAPWKAFRSSHGPDEVLVENNSIEGCFVETTPIVIQPNKNGSITIIDNRFNYDSSCRNPLFDIKISTNRRKYRTKKATAIVKNNKEIASNGLEVEASINLDAKRKKHITLIKE